MSAAFSLNPGIHVVDFVVIIDSKDCIGYHLHPHTRLWYVHPPNAELTADEITKGFVAYKKRDARFAVGSSTSKAPLG